MTLVWNRHFGMRTCLFLGVVLNERIGILMKAYSACSFQYSLQSLRRKRSKLDMYGGKLCKNITMLGKPLSSNKHYSSTSLNLRFAFLGDLDLWVSSNSC